MNIQPFAVQSVPMRKQLLYAILTDIIDAALVMKIVDLIGIGVFDSRQQRNLCGISSRPDGRLFKPAADLCHIVFKI